MRIVVLSDTHGNISGLLKAVDQQRKADVFIHLGDVQSDIEYAKKAFPDKRFFNVPGNCDFGSQDPVDGEIVLSGKRIFYTHGHVYHVKFGQYEVIEEARRRKADILLFGHTHVPFQTYDDGLYIMNPGSIGHPVEGEPTYGVIDITGAGTVMNIVEV